MKPPAVKPKDHPSAIMNTDPEESKLLERIVAAAETAKSPPIVACKLMELFDSDAPYDEFVHVIRVDPIVTTKLLRMCNSASFGLPRQVSSVDDAASCLGLAEVMKLVWQVSMGETFSRPVSSYEIPEGGLWTHAVYVAFASQELWRRCKTRPDSEPVAFTCGLLHDIGKVALNIALREEKEKIHQSLIEDADSIVAMEKRFSRFDHTEVGANILQTWKIPQRLVDAVRLHHTPPKEEATLAGLVHLANFCAHNVGSTFGVASTANVVMDHVAPTLGVCPHDLDKVMLTLMARREEIEGFVSGDE